MKARCFVVSQMRLDLPSWFSRARVLRSAFVARDGVVN